MKPDPKPCRSFSIYKGKRPPKLAERLYSGANQAFPQVLSAGLVWQWWDNVHPQPCTNYSWAFHFPNLTYTFTTLDPLTHMVPNPTELPPEGRRLCYRQFTALGWSKEGWKLTHTTLSSPYGEVIESSPLWSAEHPQLLLTSVVSEGILHLPEGTQM